MKILVLNSGSSSLKASLFTVKKSKPQHYADFIIDGIKQKDCEFRYQIDDQKFSQKIKVQTHEEAIDLVFTKIEKSEIKAVGHRVVHGGDKYSQATKIDRKLLKEIKKLSTLAPLHNPINLRSIIHCQKLLAKAEHIAVFDTAFHQSMGEKAYLYGLPYSMFKKDGVRRYGFHGSSHKYVVGEAVKIIGKKNAKIISCHLGNGSSITASINGKSIDTSMGITPLEGVMMGSRSGSIDPAIALNLAKKIGADKAMDLLNNQSGLKGFSEISSDMRKIFQKNSPRSKLTIILLSYHIAKYCGAYAAAMNGLNGIVFTGGIGENAWYIRKEVSEYLEFLGLKLDLKANKSNKNEISTEDSKIRALVIKTDEEKQIAIETLALI